MNLKTFYYQNHAIRFEGMKPVGTDVAAVLGYVDPIKTVEHIVSRNYREVYHNLILLDEPGIYQLLFSVNTTLSHNLLEWIFKTVRPSIKNTAVEVSRQVKEITENVGKINPDLAAYLIDNVLSESEIILDKKYLTATQLATKLGYEVNDSVRNKLGKHLKAKVGDLGVSRQILVKIQCYPECETINNAVQSFFRT